MPFPDKLLNEGETVVVDVRPHVWVLAWPIFLSVMVLAGAVVAVVLDAPSIVRWVLVALLVLALGYLLVRYIKWRCTTLVVTNLRLMRRTGVISREGREIPLVQLADITYHQNLFDRIIGAGDLVLESAGRESDETFPSVPGPAAVQNEIYGLIAARQGTAARPEPTLSLPEQLEKLDELWRRGVLSDAEFASTKARLLGER